MTTANEEGEPGYEEVIMLSKLTMMLNDTKIQTPTAKWWSVFRGYFQLQFACTVFLSLQLIFCFSKCT